MTKCTHMWWVCTPLWVITCKRRIHISKYNYLILPTDIIILRIHHMGKRILWLDPHLKTLWNQTLSHAAHVRAFPLGKVQLSLNIDAQRSYPDRDTGRCRWKETLAFRWIFLKKEQELLLNTGLTRAKILVLWSSWEIWKASSMPPSRAHLRRSQVTLS